MDIDELEQRYREAWLVARRVPSGNHLGHPSFWPEINPNRWEVYCGEGVKSNSTPPSTESIDRMVECMRWLRWLSEDERQLIWLRAAGLPWRVIAEDMGVNRKTPYKHWGKAMSKISIHLCQRA